MTSELTLTAEGDQRTSRSGRIDVEITVPVFNEERTLEGSLRRLHGYPQASFPFSWRVVIADNASTDGTLALAWRLSYRLAGAEAARVDIAATALADLRGVTRLLFRRSVPSLTLISRHRLMLA